MKKRYFKVKYGFNASDQVSISENDLDKAICAQIKGIPVQIGNSYINGRNIISITPHYHKYTGWYEWYEPKDGEDWKQIERDCPKFDNVLDIHKNYVSELMSQNNLTLIGKRDWENEGGNSIEAPKEKLNSFTKELSEKFRISDK